MTQNILSLPCLLSSISLRHSSHHPLFISSPQGFDLLLPAVFQRLAAAGPHRALLRLAGGQHSSGGDAGRRTQRGHGAAGRGGGGPLPALRLLSAGRCMKVASHSGKVPRATFPMSSAASRCFSALKCLSSKDRMKEQDI